jgi:hypothetical protein
MTTSEPCEPYLFGCVGPFGLLIPATMVAQVSAAHQAPQPASDILDLRRLFRLDSSDAGPQVHLTTGDGQAFVIMLDQVGKLHPIADVEFRRLPTQLGYAATMFDAVCERAIDAMFGLRLRRDPRFQPLPDAPL